MRYLLFCLVPIVLSHIFHLKVCEEETIAEIRARYLLVNKHAESYTWKRLGQVLEMEKTLKENNIEDEGDKFVDHGLDEELYLPTIHLYFNDDLTFA